MESLTENKPLFYSTVISLTALSTLLMGLLPDLSKQFDIVEFPAEVLLCLAFVVVIVDYAKLMKCVDLATFCRDMVHFDGYVSTYAKKSLFFQICICKESCILSFEYLAAVIDSYHTRLICWMCLELARKTAERRQLTFL